MLEQSTNYEIHSLNVSYWCVVLWKGIKYSLKLELAFITVHEGIWVREGSWNISFYLILTTWRSFHINKALIENFVLLIFLLAVVSNIIQPLCCSHTNISLTRVSTLASVLLIIHNDLHYILSFLLWIILPKLKVAFNPVKEASLRLLRRMRWVI